MSNNIKKYQVDLKSGLSDEEVNSRYQQGLVNFNPLSKTKSTKQIIRENVVTLFNIINIILALAVISVGSYKNLTFIIIIVINTVISTAQELHSKRIIDKLSIVSQSKIKAIRNGKTYDLNADEIVLDDLLEFHIGDQVVTDAVIRDGFVEVDESFITGESEHVLKEKGDSILSGSFIVSGNCKAQVEHIGYDNYTSKIAADTKYIKPISSEIMQSLNKIVRLVSFIIVPLGILLFSRQIFLDNNTYQNAVVNTVAALIGMIPEGLVLLTSTVLAVGVIKLSRKKVLVQDLYCIETLARVDVMCLDKTGTLTEGKMEVKDLISVSDKSKSELGNIIGMIVGALDDNNATSNALKEVYYRKETSDILSKIPFSSERKYSGITLTNKETYLIGAPEIILNNHGEEYKEQITGWASFYRVIALVKVDDYASHKNNFKSKVLGFVLLQDKIRKEAPDTLAYFKKQGVKIKIISGDNIITIQNIAKRAGVGEHLKTIDLSTVDNEEEIKKAVFKYDIFGRVRPEQKFLLIQALKEKGHTVAMVGDGVNDCLALKEADCSIAMASGSAATRSVSQLVLLDSNFASMPSVVDEGRQSINNLERSASLFLVKTIYSFILSFLFLFIEMSYPFIPIQLTLASVVTIGIPSFILALEPNHDRVKGNFLKNVLKKATPPALTIVLNIMIITIIGSIFHLDYNTISTLCLTLTAYTSFILLYKICQPFNIIRLVLFLTMFVLFIFALFKLPELFSISSFTTSMVLIILCLTFLSHQLYTIFEYLIDLIIKKLFKQKSLL